MAASSSASPFVPTGRACSRRAPWPSARALIGIHEMIDLDRIAQVVVTAALDTFQYQSASSPQPRALGPAPDQRRGADDTGRSPLLLANGSPCGTAHAAGADLALTVFHILDCNDVRPHGGWR